MRIIESATPSSHEQLATQVRVTVWDRPLTALPNIGPKTSSLLAKATGGDRLRDLLLYLPGEFVDRRSRRHLWNAAPGEVATFLVLVFAHDLPLKPGRPIRVTVGDSSGTAYVPLFRPGLLKKFPVGQSVIISGVLTIFREERQFTRVDHVVPAASPGLLPWVEPIWRLTKGLTGFSVRSAMRQALSTISPLPEWQDRETISRYSFPSFSDALTSLQSPVEMPVFSARRRLAYDELFARQVRLAMLKRKADAIIGRPLVGDGHLRREALTRFGHKPTQDQKSVMAEIFANMKASTPMFRLLLGDVGSGKTLIAILAMLQAVEAGAQAAMLAPTELLAMQHHRTLSRLSPVPVACLVGSTPPAQKRAILKGLADGTVPLVVGTHALIQEAVCFRDLGLAVIDEQHRFGVAQRQAFSGKGAAAHVLVMTATPIPRTVVLAKCGGMAVSRITGKPAGRKPVKTTTHSVRQIKDVYEAIGRMVGTGGRVYWVCPLVGEGEPCGIAAAQTRFEGLKGVFGGRVVLAHGQQSAEERQQALARFTNGECDILVSTTVVEVGVDVPEATAMVIEHAERFGVAQLHQLRGRVGRGKADSYCLLLHADKPSAVAKQRLDLLRETNDGFRIADADYALRGGGDLLGTSQSGLPDLKIADIEMDADLLECAHKDASNLVSSDPNLSSDRGKAVRSLLYIFWGSAANDLAA
jgi:ATP-dependent DNA helicase RecG